MGEFNAMEELKAAGFAVSAASESQQQVLQNLTADEIAVLTSVKVRLTEAGPDLEAHNDETSGSLFW